MDLDLKDQIAQVLSPEAASLASTVGMDDGQAKSFIEAAIPALLAGFLKSFETQGGAKALSDAVSNSDPGLLERLRHALAARDLAPLNEGVNALAPVLGPAMRDKLANGLADLIVAPIEATAPALGAVEQAAIAVIGQQDPSVWSDADAIRNYFVSQKGSFLPAVPASLAGLVGALAPPRPTPAAPAPPPPPPRSTTPRPPPPPEPSGGFPTWIIMLIVVVILAAVGYYYWASRNKPESGLNAPSSEFALDLTAKTRF
jgi:hypothetical protein